MQHLEKAKNKQKSPEKVVTTQHYIIQKQIKIGSFSLVNCGFS